MTITIYGVSFIISVLYLLILLTLYRKHITPPYILLSVCVIVTCFGYWLLSGASTLEGALYGNRVTYLASCFSSFFMMLCIAHLCRIHVPEFVIALCTLTGLIIFGMTFLVGGESGLYYKEVKLITENGSSYLEKVYGPLHIIYPIYVCLLMIYGFVMVIVALRKKNEVSSFSCLMCFFVMTVTYGIYLAERLCNTKSEWMPVAFIISYAIILMLLERVKLYDISGFASTAMAESDEYGFILFDNEGRFERADHFARECFPELNELAIDHIPNNNESELLVQIRQWINKRWSSAGTNGLDMALTAGYICGDRHIEVRCTTVKEWGRRPIYCVRLRDDTAQQKYAQLITDYNEKLESEVKQKTRKIMRVQDDIITSMAAIVENRDSNTGGHIQRSSSVVRVFVEYLIELDYIDMLTDSVAEKIIKAAPLHDFGKIAIPDAVLNKPGRFTIDEYEVMKYHPEKGAVIVEKILHNSDDEQFRAIAVNVAHYHHEKWNGEGYPVGLKGTDIPFEARVMALADVFDALVSKRVYKESMSYDKAFKIIEESSGTHFDPDLCEKFLECRQSLIDLYESFED